MNDNRKILVIHQGQSSGKTETKLAEVNKPSEIMLMDQYPSVEDITEMQMDMKPCKERPAPLTQKEHWRGGRPR